MTGRPGPRMTCSCGCSERPGVLEQRKLQAGMEEKRLLDRLWDTYGMTHQGALAVRVPVEDAAQPSGARFS